MKKIILLLSLWLLVKYNYAQTCATFETASIPSSTPYYYIENNIIITTQYKSNVTIPSLDSNLHFNNALAAGYFQPNFIGNVLYINNALITIDVGDVMYSMSKIITIDINDINTMWIDGYAHMPTTIPTLLPMGITVYYTNGSSGKQLILEGVISQKIQLAGWGLAIDNICISATTTNIKNVSITTLQNIYPNPSIGIFTIENLEKNSSVTITNTLGQIVYNETTLTNNVTIDLSAYTKGIYFVTINDDKKNQTKKIIIK